MAPATSRGPLMHGRQTVLAHGPMAIDVLEDDDRVVDDASDGHRQAAQGHDVEGDAGELHEHERGEDRQRDADRGHERRADAEQEQEDRQDREQRAQAALAHAGRRCDSMMKFGQVADGRDGQISPGWRAAISASLAWTASRDLDGVGGGRLGDGQRQRRVAVGAARSRSWRRRSISTVPTSPRLIGVGHGRRRRGRRAIAPGDGRRRAGSCSRRRGSRSGRPRSKRADRRDRDARAVGRQLAGREGQVVRLQDARRSAGWRCPDAASLVGSRVTARRSSRPPARSTCATPSMPEISGTISVAGDLAASSRPPSRRGRDRRDDDRRRVDVERGDRRRRPLPAGRPWRCSASIAAVRLLDVRPVRELGDDQGDRVGRRRLQRARGAGRPRSRSRSAWSPARRRRTRRRPG